jgi:hypothetical protein
MPQDASPAVAWIQVHLAVALPLFVLAMWLTVTVFLTYLSGWIPLMRQFPDRGEPALMEITGQSGSMGQSVSMGGVLNIAVCPSGLRIGIMRLFGPFSRPFFVPWASLRVVRTRGWFGPLADLQFGTREQGHLTIAGHVANRLARAAGEHWPESGPLNTETRITRLRRFARQWLLLTIGGSLFFLAVPDLVWADANPVPVPLAILFPAIAAALGLILQYRSERGG